MFRHISRFVNVMFRKQPVEEARDPTSLAFKATKEEFDAANTRFNRVLRGVINHANGQHGCHDADKESH